MQVIATVFCSVGVILLATTFFLPANKGRCCSPVSVGKAAGALIVCAAVFGVIGFALFLEARKAYAEAEGVPVGEIRLGATFGVHVTACALAFVLGITLLASAKAAGNGPFSCCSSCSDQPQPHQLREYGSPQRQNAATGLFPPAVPKQVNV